MGRKVYRNPIKTMMLLQFEVFDVVAVKLLNSPLSDGSFLPSGVARGSGVGREWVGSESGVSPE